MRTLPALAFFWGLTISVAGCSAAGEAGTDGPSSGTTGPGTTTGAGNTTGAGSTGTTMTATGTTGTGMTATGTTGTGMTGAGGATTTGSGTSTGQGGGGAGWTLLITGDWYLPPGGEVPHGDYTLTIPKDIYIGAIRPVNPPGTHHTLLSLNGIGTLSNVIYASGIGTNELWFPPGVGLKLKAGDTLGLTLHVFNTSPQPLAGTSGIEVIELQPSQVQYEADLFLPGPIIFSIPPNQTYTAGGPCTAQAPQTVFAVFPHMHQLGVHLKTTLTIGGVPQVIHDGPYQFDHQAFIPFGPVAMQAGDVVTSECTWNNTTPFTVGWGESSTAEMCFSIMYRYPAQADFGPSGICSF